MQVPPRSRCRCRREVGTGAALVVRKLVVVQVQHADKARTFHLRKHCVGAQNVGQAVLARDGHWVGQGGCVRARAHERRNGAEGYEAAGSKTSQGLRQMRRSLRCGWCECGRVRGIAVPQSASPQSARPCFSRCTPAARSSTALEMPTMQTEARAVRCAVDANRACINHNQRHSECDTENAGTATPAALFPYTFYADTSGVHRSQMEILLGISWASFKTKTI